MPTLLQQRCFNHAAREAAARCPDCGRFFCRECVTPHQGRVVCATCLSRLGGSRQRHSSLLQTASRLVQGLAGLAVVWALFYMAGRVLLSLPDSFHEGTFWKAESKRSGPSAGETRKPAALPHPGGED